MPADYKNSHFLNKDEDGNPGEVYPLNSTLSSHFELEPIITPDQLIYRHLFGIPLVSRIVDPTTGKPAVLTHDILKDYINRATQEAEVETQIDINPKKYHERLPYLRSDYQSFGYLKVNHHPGHSIDMMSVQLADDQNIFVFPPQFMDTSNFIFGTVNFIPLAFSASFSNSVIGSGLSDPRFGNGTYFISLWNSNYVNALFGISYTTGFVNREVPLFINELIGTIAAIKILSALAATYRIQSTSIGLDGVSQSIASNGPLLFVTRIQELVAQRKLLVDRTRMMFGSGITMNSI